MGFTFGAKRSERTESSGMYLRNFKKGDTKVRFLQEPNEWHDYFEHFMDGKSFPCMEIPECPGCAHPNSNVSRRSRRYGTFLLLVENKRVLPFKIGARLSERLITRAERNGKTLKSRDYVIIRSGTGLETDYDVDQDERYEVDTDELWKQRGEFEIEQILTEQFKELFGDPEAYLAQVRRDRQDAAAESRVSEPKHAAEDDTPPWEKSPSTESSDIEISEAQLNDMSRAQLHEVWVKAGFGEDAWNDDWSRQEIVAQILRKAE